MAEKKTEQERFLQKKLYDVTLSFDPESVEEEVKNVGLIGEFLFYKSNLKDHTDEEGMAEHDPKYPPAKYEEGMAQIGGRYYQEMKLNEETGLYEISLKLPAGMYPYGFQLNAELSDPSDDPRMSWQNVMTEDGSMHSFGEFRPWLPDPKNPPFAPTKDGVQMNSELYVGSPDELPWLPAKNPSVKGLATYVSYKDIKGDDRTMGIYLPANYDRSKEYPVIFVSHGGGGNECDWFSQGGLVNIMDNLIAAHRTEEAIVVTMNNSVYDWNFADIDQNVIQCIIPYLRKVYAVTKDPKKMAFCGLSMGGITTMYTYMHHPELFGYFGCFSAGFAGGEGFTLENPHLHDVKLLIGCAEEDISYNERDIGTPPTIRKLKEAGIPYIPYFVTGSHDWFCWPEMFRYFAENVLWK